MSALPREDWQWLADQLRAWPVKRVHPERTMCDGALRPMAADVIEAALALLTREAEAPSNSKGPREAEVRGEERERAARIAEDKIAEFADAENAGNDDIEEAWHNGMAHAAQIIATAIRDGATGGDGWQPIETAPKDGTIIWAAFHPRIWPDIRPQREDLERWNGVQVSLRHPGIVEYDEKPFDMGWNVAAPVGNGGFPDEWIVGWKPLPAPPAVRGGD